MKNTGRIHIYLLGIIFLIIIMLMAGPVAGGETTSTNGGLKLVPPTPVASGETTSTNGGLMVMPPSPGLLERVERGEAELPAFFTDPELRKSLGINQPGEKIQPSGDWRAIALLVDFSDKASSTSAAYFDTLLFGTGTGSVNDYYNEVSYGALDIVTVNLPSSTGWMTMPQTYAYYVGANNGRGTYPNNAQKLAEDAVIAANPAVNYSNYDNDGDGVVESLFIIHAGPGAENTGQDYDIWSHKWNMVNPPTLDMVTFDRYTTEPELFSTPGDMTIGVYAHELAHAFGVFDFYDTDYSSWGIGDWGMMGGGSYNGTPEGSSPAWFSAWSRAYLGFVTPIDVVGGLEGANIPAAETSPTVYRLWNDSDGASEAIAFQNIVIKGGAGPSTIAYDMVGSANQNLISFTDDPAIPFTSDGDGFNKYQRGVSPAIPFAFVDESAGSFPSDPLGIIKTGNTDEFFGIVDTYNPDVDLKNPYVEADWVFDISGASNLSLSIDMGAMGDFEAIPATDYFNWSYRIDGGAWQTAFQSSVDETITQTYTMESGALVYLGDPMLVNGVLLNDDLQTLTAALTGSGSQLTLRLTAVAESSNEYFLVENRQPIGYDAALPGSGLLIWHIDDSKFFSKGNDQECDNHYNWQCGNAHAHVALEQADGYFNLEEKVNQGEDGDPFPGWTGNRDFSPLSTLPNTMPNSGSYYHTFDTCIGVNYISDSAATMTADLIVSCDFRPSNDDFEYAFGFSLWPVILTNVDTSTATTQPTDPDLPSGCGEDLNPQQSRSVWYKFIPVQAGQYNINTNGSDYDTVLSVWTGALGSLTNVACDDDGGADGSDSSLDINVSSGETYYIEVNDYGNNNIGGLLDFTVYLGSPCYRLITSVDPLGSGSTLASPLPNCDYNTYLQGETVFLSADESNIGYNFDSWSGDIGGASPTANPISLVMNEHRDVTANFTPAPCYTLTVAGNPVASGAVNLSPAPNCAGTQYYEDTLVTLTAAANIGFKFDNWSGDFGPVSPTANPINVVMDQDRNITADFSALPPIIVVAPASLSAEQGADVITTQPLTIHNNGAGVLNWNIVEDDFACVSPIDIPWLSVAPSAGTTPPGGGSSPTTVTFDSTGLAVGTYNANLCINSDDPVTPVWQVPVSLTVGTPELLVCNGPTIAFESGIPAGWQVVDNTGGTGIVWTTTADGAACFWTNDTNGSGEAACADSFAAGLPAVPYDTELVSPAIDLTGQISATLNVKAFYQDDGTGNDFFEVDVWDGANWTTELSWDESHSFPGEDISLDLSAYAGIPDAKVRFRYSGDGWDLYAEVDDIALTCTPVVLPTISGTVKTSSGVGISGAVMSVSGPPSSPTTAGDGSYSAEVTDGWSGTVQPLSAGLPFTPTYRTYSNVTVDMTNQDYTRTDPSGAPILLVDDDDNLPDIRNYYTAILDSLGLEYDIWDTLNSDVEPDAGTLNFYSTVIWFTGAEFGGAAGPGSVAELTLGNWLDGENCLFISSQDYHYDRGSVTPFMNNYLGVESVTDDLGAYIDVTGQGSVFGGLGPYTLAYPFGDYSDIISPTLTAELAFLGDNGKGAAIANSNGLYHTTFLGFPFEAFGIGPERLEAMNAFLDSCQPGNPPTITHTPLTTAGAGLSLPLTATVTSEAPPLTVTLFYSSTGDTAYTGLPMANTGGDVYEATIPDTAVLAPVLNYYLEATDTISTTVDGPHLVTVILPSISGYVKTSGGIGISGIVLSGLPGDPITAGDGSYSADVPNGWSGTVIPLSAGLPFTPASRVYNNVTADKTNQDYTRTDPSGAPILLVDDDDNSPDVRATYTETLDALAVDYDIWDTLNSDVEPDAGTLNSYSTVIWFTGAAFGNPGPTAVAGPGSAAEATLGNWLDGGNCLFISSQDYHYDRGLTPFMNNYLGLDSATDDVGFYINVTGQGSVFGGLGPYTLAYPFADYSDIISPTLTAELAFLGDNGNGATVAQNNGVYQTSFWGFPFEVISTGPERVEAMSAFLASCQPGNPPVITHTPLTSAAAGLSLPLTATVTSTAPPLTVTLYYSSTGDTVYTGLLMANTGGDVYEAAIPAGAVLTPTLSYYLEADDANAATVDGPHQVTVLEVPPAPVPLSPSGVIADTTPTYSWQEAATATDYQLYLTDADGQFVYAEWVSAAAVCAAGACSHTPTPVLDQADYKWNVRANNVAGNSPWSPAKTFTIFTGSAAPGPATLLAPNTTIADTTPTYSWQAVTDAIRYRVYLLDGDRLFAYGTIVQARNACSAGTCSYNMPTPLVDGDYRFFIRAENPLGGTWSAPMLFTLFTGSAAPGPATLVAPNGDIADSTPTYQWNEVPQAIKYKVYLIDDDRQFVYGTIVQAQNACIAGACSHTAPAPLADGDYRFFIQAINPLGATWSAPMLFTLFTGSAAPGQATLLTPNGTIADNTPTYEWLEASDAIQYQVYLLDGGGLFVYGAYVQANNACGGGICSLTPGIVLPNDDYRWFVQAINPLGTTWSVPMDFTLGP